MGGEFFVAGLRSLPAVRDDSGGWSRRQRDKVEITEQERPTAKGRSKRQHMKGHKQG